MDQLVVTDHQNNYSSNV